MVNFMKKIKIFCLGIIVSIIRFISKLLKIQILIFRDKIIPYQEQHFNDFGPRILIVRNNEVLYLGHAFTMVLNFDKDKNPVSIKPIFLLSQKEDLVFYGTKNTDEKYEKYHYNRSSFIDEND
jgi:hypothetical protein